MERKAKLRPAKRASAESCAAIPGASGTISIMSTTTLTDADARIAELEEKLQALKKDVSEARRARPPEVVKDWELQDLDGKPVRLSGLFGGHYDLLVIHNMGKRCNYCTLWADGMNGFVRHFDARCGFALCSADPPAIAREHAKARGWTYRVVSGAASEFARAMGFTDEKGAPWPGVSAFHKRTDGSIVRTGKAPFGPGDDFCAVWPLFDLFEGGAGKWEPR